uniref:hypothetical protein n=1 Tax=Vibrio tapetis TaxID=52443 RepID=UPI00155DAEAD|nr:hypothetical protein [Vibrio tapetis]
MRLALKFITETGITRNAIVIIGHYLGAESQGSLRRARQNKAIHSLIPEDF